MADLAARDQELQTILVKLYTHLDVNGSTYTNVEFRKLTDAMQVIGDIVKLKTGWFH